jgi:hypothetical protein
MNTGQYTLNGKQYDLLIQDGSIILQSLSEDLIFDHGFEACKDSARAYCNGLTTERGLPQGYSESQVYDVAVEYIADYIQTETYTTLTHDLN